MGLKAVPNFSRITGFGKKYNNFIQQWIYRTVLLFKCNCEIKLQEDIIVYLYCISQSFLCILSLFYFLAQPARNKTFIKTLEA